MKKIFAKKILVLTVTFLIILFFGFGYFSVFTTNPEPVSAIKVDTNDLVSLQQEVERLNKLVVEYEKANSSYVEENKKCADANARFGATNIALGEKLEEYKKANAAFVANETSANEVKEKVFGNLRSMVNELAALAYDKSIKTSLINNLLAVGIDTQLANKMTFVWAEVICSSLDRYVTAGFIPDRGTNCLNIPQ